MAATTDAPSLAKELARLTFPAHMAGSVGTGFAPMDADAERFLTECMDNMHVIRMSTGDLKAKKLRVYRGPLVGHERRIRHIDRDKSLARVRVGASTTHEGFVLDLPLEVPAKYDDEPTQVSTHATERSAIDLAGIPFDARDTSGRTRWYIATCVDGQEHATCAELRANIPQGILTEAFVPRMEQQGKYHGEWKIEERVLLRGMFIVVTDQIRRLASKLVDMPSGVDLVRGPDKWPAPIAIETQEFLERLMDDEHVVRLSWSEIVDDELQIYNGPLTGLEHRVASYNRRKCYAKVHAREGDDEHVLYLPLAITARRASGNDGTSE